MKTLWSGAWVTLWLVFPQARAQDAADLKHQADGARKTDTRRAESLYREALVKDPQHFDAALALGELLFNADRFPDAVQAFEQAVAARPADSGARYNLGYALRKAGRPADAVAQYREYTRMKANDPDGWFGLAESERDSGLTAEALADYRRYVDLEKRPAEAEWVARARQHIQALEHQVATAKKTPPAPPGTAPHPGPRPCTRRRPPCPRRGSAAPARCCRARPCGRRAGSASATRRPTGRCATPRRSPAGSTTHRGRRATPPAAGFHPRRGPVFWRQGVCQSAGPLPGSRLHGPPQRRGVFQTGSVLCHAQ